MAMPAAAGPVDWAHWSGKINTNGAVTVKSLSGGSYAATSNPGGAVAKSNQNAATQPPTVIIQATGAGFSETIPYLVSGTSFTCPSGYSQTFSYVGSGGSPFRPIYNAGGSRFTLAYFALSNNGSPSTYFVGWAADYGSQMALYSNQTVGYGFSPYFNGAVNSGMAVQVYSNLDYNPYFSGGTWTEVYCQ